MSRGSSQPRCRSAGPGKAAPLAAGPGCRCCGERERGARRALTACGGGVPRPAGKSERNERALVGRRAALRKLRAQALRGRCVVSLPRSPEPPGIRPVGEDPVRALTPGRAEL